MIEPIFKDIIGKLTDPMQIISMAVILCLFLIVRMMLQLLNRKEDILEGLIRELSEHGNSVRESVKLLEFLVYGKRGKG